MFLILFSTFSSQTTLYTVMYTRVVRPNFDRPGNWICFAPNKLTTHIFNIYTSHMYFVDTYKLKHVTNMSATPP